jgi:osmoprotectant transport system substrate-binding protein
MTRENIPRRWATFGVALALVITSCGSKDPTETTKQTDSASTAKSGSTQLVVGSQAYYSNEILAEIYSQALEAKGVMVSRQFQIGQREIYLPELRAGKIDVFPEYVGSLLQAINKGSTGSTTQAVYDDLKKALPDGLNALQPSEASDQNSWTVTKAFAQKYNLTDIASLKKVTEPITVGGNSELETRPYGPKSLKDKYGIEAGFKAVEDSGGPLTVKALVDGDIQLANVYTADPNLTTNNLVALTDPDGLFVPDNVTPVVSTKVDARARETLDKVSKALTQQDLVALNAESVRDKKAAKDIAKAWLVRQGLSSP